MKIFKLYKTFLMSQNGQCTATKLSKILNNKISHDKITRYLNTANLSESDIWSTLNNNQKFKKTLIKDETNLIIDDTIISKEYRKENNHVCWHYNHAKGRCEKGIQLMTCYLTNVQTGVPMNYKIIEKTEYYKEKKTGKLKRKSKITKNEYFREILRMSNKRINGKYNYILADSWFCSKKNISFINDEIKKKFIIGIKSNRLIQLEKKGGTHSNAYQSLQSANLKPDKVYRVRLKGVNFPVILVKKVFKNGGKDNIGVSYLISNDVKLKSNELYNCYQRRWRVEEYHRSIKQYTSISNCQCYKEKTQSNHIVLSLLAYIELQELGKSTKKGIHSLRYEILLKSNKLAFKAMCKVQNDVA